MFPLVGLCLSTNINRLGRLGARRTKSYHVFFISSPAELVALVRRKLLRHIDNVATGDGRGLGQNLKLEGAVRDVPKK